MHGMYWDAPLPSQCHYFIRIHQEAWSMGATIAFWRVSFLIPSRKKNLLKLKQSSPKIVHFYTCWNIPESLTTWFMPRPMESSRKSLVHRDITHDLWKTRFSMGLHSRFEDVCSSYSKYVVSIQPFQLGTRYTPEDNIFKLETSPHGRPSAGLEWCLVGFGFGDACWKLVKGSSSYKPPSPKSTIARMSQEVRING